MLEGLDDLVEGGYITRRKHPSLDLYILNYTARTQYERLWNETTAQCRGLVVDSSGKVVSRCLKKFFNFEEVREEVASRLELGTPFKVFEKVDGSLGITYWTPEGPRIATRGRFTSAQAMRASLMLKELYGSYGLDPEITYLFEIVYPENRICVDYGDLESLIFLGAIHTKSGVEVDSRDLPFEKAKEFEFGVGFDEMKRMNLKNREGFVVKFDDSFRFKIKFDDYVRLHSEIFSLSTKSVWTSLKDGRRTPVEMLAPELQDWAQSVELDLMRDFASIECSAAETFDSIKSLSRKEFAMVAMNYRFSSVLFHMLDERPYSDIIWKMVEPEFRRPRNEEI